MSNSAEGEVCRQFVNGPWNGDLRAVDESELIVYSHETIKTFETLKIEGIPRKVPVLSQVHFIYELDEIDDVFVCLVAGTKAECEAFMERKLGDSE